VAACAGLLLPPAKPGADDALQKVGEYLRYHSALDARVSEFLMLIVSRIWTQQFEWAVHYPLVLQAGLAPEVASALGEGRRPQRMADDEKIAYDFAEELLRTHDVSEATYQRTVTRFGERGVIDMIGLLGYFTTVSMVLNVAHTPSSDSKAGELVALPL
jgi:4-carboxymuconolactone decarboxylase